MALDYLTPDEVALLLATPIATLTAWRAAKRNLPYIKKRNRRVLYRRCDVEEYIRRQEQELLDYPIIHPVAQS